MSISAEMQYREIEMQHRQNAMRFGTKYTDQDIIAGLQKCEKDLGDSSFGVKRYSEWRSNQEEDYASSPLILRRMINGDQGWNAWKAAAGQGVNKKGPSGFGRRLYEDQDFYLVFARLEESLGYFPTVRQYDEMRLKGEPSGASVRVRLGKWSQAYALYNEWKNPQKRLFDCPAN